MNHIKTYFLIAAICFIAPMTYAQTADEIIDGYFEATGGRDAWSKVENMKIYAKVNQGGMEIPLEIVECKDGKSYTKVSVQGMNIMQGVYDGETLWNTNFQTMKPEKATSEDLANHKRSLGDFPDALFNYKDNGYKTELIGKESFDGTESYKIKLTKKPVLVDGAEVDNIEFYFFDTETMILLGSEAVMTSGPMKGKTAQSKMSEYDEVDGLYFPFSMSQGEKDGMSQSIKIDKIEVNADIDDNIMAFPAAAGMAAPAAEPAKGEAAPTTAPTMKKAPTTAPSGNN
jgi:hypothetical protein